MNASRSLVSVVIPSYNHATFVAEAVRSVANQDGVDLELIVVDDGSTDGSPRIVEQALAAFPGRSEMIVQANQGAHAAINRGLSLARGTHLHILNSDDRFCAGRLTTMLAAIGGARTALAFSDVCVIGADGAPLPRFHPRVAWCRRARRIMLSEPTIGYGLLRINAAITTSNFLFTRELLERVGEFSPERLCHDWTFLVRVLPWTEPIHVPDSLLDYRVHGNNTVDRVMALRRQEGEPALRRYFQGVSENIPENKLAPCGTWWPGFFSVFVASRRPWFSDEPMVFCMPQSVRSGSMMDAAAESNPRGAAAKRGVEASPSVRPPAEPRDLLSVRERDTSALLREIRARDRLLAECGRRVAADVTETSDAARDAAWRNSLLRISTLSAPPLSPRPTAIIFGASKGGERALAFLNPCWHVAGFVDNDAQKHGREFCDRPVLAPGAVDAMGEAVIFVASAYRDAIQSQLCGAGVPRHRIQHVNTEIVADMVLSNRTQPKVVLFGSELGVRAVVRHLAGTCRVLAHGDDPTEAGRILSEILDLPLPEVEESEFDFVVVASPRSDEIVGRLDELGCPHEKIVVVHPDLVKATCGRAESAS